MNRDPSFFINRYARTNPYSPGKPGEAMAAKPKKPDKKLKAGSRMPQRYMYPTRIYSLRSKNKVSRDHSSIQIAKLSEYDG